MVRIILLSILALILFLLVCPVTVRFEYTDGEIRLRLSYFLFRLFQMPSEKKPKKAKKPKKEKQPDKGKTPQKTEQPQEPPPEQPAADAASAESEKPKKDKEKKKPKASLEELFELVKLVLDSLGKPLKRLLHRVVIDKLRIEIICGGEDAAKAAINFGRMNILVGNALGWLGSFFTLKDPEQIHIDVDFYSESTDVSVSLRVKATVITFLAFAFTLLFRAVRYYLSHPKARTAVGKLAK